MEALLEDVEQKEVVYLFGAGASHACAAWVDSPHGILMRDLIDPLLEELTPIAQDTYREDPRLEALVNTVIDNTADIEQIITFLAQSPSASHHKLADKLRHAFVRVLKSRLAEIEAHNGKPPIQLYQALIDLYDIGGFKETLKGVLTLNYDMYIEEAIRSVGRDVDFGIVTDDVPTTSATYRLIKLHGSLDWKHAWPIALHETGEAPFWIPPGIQKLKDQYPFNALWGSARELLDCDVLRIVGCNLSPNDWDLIALLFATRHTHDKRTVPYQVEVIDSPTSTARLRNAFPYLDIHSIFEAGAAGKRFFFEITGDADRSYASLSRAEQEEVELRLGSQNWFKVWLQHMAEGLLEEKGSVATPSGHVERFLEAA